jgi:hypothetical protein
MSEVASVKLGRARLPIAVGAAAAVVHFLVCIAISLGAVASEGSWKWFIPFLMDFPASILFLPLQGVLPNLLVFGVLGSAWWFLLFWVGTRLVLRLSRPSLTKPS